MVLGTSPLEKGRGSGLMNRQVITETAAILSLLIIATAVIALTGADIAVSSQFYQNGGWPLGHQFPWRLLYKIDRWPALIMAVAGLLLFVFSYYRPDLKRWRKAGPFLVLLLIIGPGLLVNSVFKQHWDRPRPVDVTEFSGRKEFLNPWQPGISGKGRSFPSGHTSAAFYLTAPYFIYRRRKKGVALAWLAGGIAFGIMMSIARITQGGHFLSDTLWAWGMVHLTALLLAALLKIDHDGPPPKGS